jgi:HK97 family phage prohead protease
MHRAYAKIEIKAVNEDERVIEGIASTPSPDRMSDVVEPMGAKFALPLPLLWQHRHDLPIGHVVAAKATKEGIPFKAKLVHPDQVESAELKERLQLAWDSIKSGLVRAVSIGFRSLKDAYDRERGGYDFESWEWLELSAVTIPANQDASITVIRSIDEVARHSAYAQNSVKAIDELGHAHDPSKAEIRELGFTPKEEPSAQTPDPAATGKQVHVAKLKPVARDGAKPFVINKINHLS